MLVIDESETLPKIFALSGIITIKNQRISLYPQKSEMQSFTYFSISIPSRQCTCLTLNWCSSFISRAISMLMTILLHIKRHDIYLFICIYVAILLTPLHQLWLAMGKKRFEESKFSKLEAFKWVNCVSNERKI